MSFGEKTQEYSTKQQKDLPVWQSPKYLEAKKKALEIIASEKYGITEADFWILMNETKSGKMAYTSLILSHNGCLKINSCLESPFDPESVSKDKDGYNNSLVYTYCNKAQGIYEVGEISKENCKNAYPYAMAFKRLFDRVVLKLSKLAFSGIMSEVESEEFSQPELNTEIETPKTTTNNSGEKTTNVFVCEKCGSKITKVKNNGVEWTTEQFADYSYKQTGRFYCAACFNRVKNGN